MILTVSRRLIPIQQTASDWERYDYEVTVFEHDTDSGVTTVCPDACPPGFVRGLLRCEIDGRLATLREDIMKVIMVPAETK